MGPLDAFWHLVNLFAPAVLVALFASGAVKLLWRRQLAGVPFKRLASWAGATNIVVTLAMLVLLGGDGQVIGYAALVIACTLALWWAGFGPGRR
jgi:hypothetical protein